MSRIIIKNLPKNINEETLRKIFGSKGTITDLKLKYTKNGKFRQFCYVGYQLESEAKNAVNSFNNTCIHTRKIKVEICDNLGNQSSGNSHSQYSKHVKKLEESEEKKHNSAYGESKNKFITLIEKQKHDPNFVEFLETHESRTLWGNDVDQIHKVPTSENDQVSGISDDEQQKQVERKEIVKLAEKQISDLDYMKSLVSKENINTNASQINKANLKLKPNLDLFTIKIHNVPYRTKRKDIIKFFKPLKPYSIRLPAKVHGFCYAGFKTEKELQKALLKNRSFISGKQVFFTDFTKKNKINKMEKEESKIINNDKLYLNSTNSSRANKWEQQKESVLKFDISESGCIFFRNLAYTVCLEDLQKLFEKFGPLVDIDLPVDPVTKQIKGFGTVTFVMPENALQAFNKLDGTTFCGRLLHLIPGKFNSNEGNNEANVNISFKQKKCVKQKLSAEQPCNWNTLFLGTNAIADVLAQKFQTSKENILDTRDAGSSAAVRIALGETQLVIEMKKFLEQNGVQISAFDTKTTTYSKTTMLAKNLPSNTTSDELNEIFKKFGQISRLILPPNGITAIIEYENASEAKRAFKKLAYSKFKNVPLYLEWAPETIFQTPVTPKENSNMNNSQKNETEEKIENSVEGSINPLCKDDEDMCNLPEENSTLFLHNLNFKTIETTIYEHFKTVGPIHTVEIAKRRESDNSKDMVSLGYGFIQFKRAFDAAKALKTMQLCTIDNNRVELKRSDRMLRANVRSKNTHKIAATVEQTGSKILVRNIPFQAKEHEVRDIFKTFGELRSIRLPKKCTPGETSIRGFGFIDYVSKSDARKAFEAIGLSTHLYGRRLVLEWASSTENDIVELRKRAAQECDSSEMHAKKKLNVDMILDSNNENE